jgi:hypothetical protein
MIKQFTPEPGDHVYWVMIETYDGGWHKLAWYPSALWAEDVTKGLQLRGFNAG